MIQVKVIRSSNVVHFERDINDILFSLFNSKKNIKILDIKWMDIVSAMIVYSIDENQEPRDKDIE